MMQICHRKEFAQECSKADFSSIIPSFMFGMSALLVLFIIFCSGLILSIDPSSIIITLVLLVLELLKPPVSLLFRIIIRTMVTRNTVVDRIFVRFGKRQLFFDLSNTYMQVWYVGPGK